MHLLKVTGISFLLVVSMVGLIAFVSVLSGCNETTRKEMFPTEAEAVNKIRYYKDERTGLCFVVSNVSEYPVGTASVYSYVPCSPEVEKLISK